MDLLILPENYGTFLINGEFSTPQISPIIPQDNQLWKESMALSSISKGEGQETMSPIERLCKALYEINVLNCSFSEPAPPVLRHFSNLARAKLDEKLSVLIKQTIDQQFSLTVIQGARENAANNQVNNVSTCKMMKSHQHGLKK